MEEITGKKRRSSNPCFSTGNTDEGQRGRASDALKYLDVPQIVIDTLYERIVNDTTMIVKVDGCSCCTRAASTSSSNHSENGPRIAMDHSGVHYNLLCKVVVTLKRGEFPRHKKDTCSHLCGNQFCVDHCVWERLWQNIWRDECHEGEHLECPHNPKCMKRPDMKKVMEAVTAQRDNRKKH
jgi:hypothetical protein